MKAAIVLLLCSWFLARYSTLEVFNDFMLSICEQQVEECILEDGAPGYRITWRAKLRS